jgi:hypothetical protein
MAISRSVRHVFLHDAHTHVYYNLGAELGKGSHGIVNRLQVADKSPDTDSMIFTVPEGVSRATMQASAAKQPHSVSVSRDISAAESEGFEKKLEQKFVETRASLLAQFQAETVALQKYHNDVNNIFLLNGAPALQIKFNKNRNFVLVCHDYAIFLIMPLVTGLSLYRWVRTPQTSLSMMLNVCMNLIQEISRFHDVVGYLHLDLHGLNIYLNANGEVSLIDLGSSVKNNIEIPVLVDVIPEDRYFKFLRPGRIIPALNPPSPCPKVNVSQDDDVYAAIVEIEPLLNQLCLPRHEAGIAVWLFEQLEELADELNIRHNVSAGGSACEAMHLIKVAKLLEEVYRHWRLCERECSPFSIFFVYQALYVCKNYADRDVFQGVRAFSESLYGVIKAVLERYGEAVARDKFDSLNKFPDLNERTYEDGSNLALIESKVNALNVELLSTAVTQRQVFVGDSAGRSGSLAERFNRVSAKLDDSLSFSDDDEEEPFSGATSVLGYSQARSLVSSFVDLGDPCSERSNASLLSNLTKVPAGFMYRPDEKVDDEVGTKTPNLF